jgi:hypothetical protein
MFWMSAYCCLQVFILRCAAIRKGVSRCCGSREQPVLLTVATTPKPLMHDAEVNDQAPAARLVSQVVPDFHIAAPWACAGRDAELCADLWKRGQSTETIQSCALNAPERTMHVFMWSP